MDLNATMFKKIGHKKEKTKKQKIQTLQEL